MSDDAKLPAVPELRDRVTAILSIRFALTPDEEWLARTLLAALDTIDRLEGENASLREAMQSDVSGATDYDLTWQALNGGNESGDDR